MSRRRNQPVILDAPRLARVVASAVISLRLAPAGRKKMLVAAAAGVVVTAGAGAYFTDGATAMTSKGVNLLDAMRDRSPGSRSAGALSNKGQTAGAPAQTVANAATQPSARALPKTRVRVAPPVAAAAGVPAAAGSPAIGGTPPATTLASIPPGSAGSGGGLGLPPGGGGFIPAPGGGGGGTPDPGTGTPPPVGGEAPPVAAPAVPEPQTWLMMIIGFGLLGSVLRRRRTSTAYVSNEGHKGLA